MSRYLRHGHGHAFRHSANGRCARCGMPLSHAFHTRRKDRVGFPQTPEQASNKELDELYRGED